jgi:serine/threonine protein phosphatase PrpC
MARAGAKRPLAASGSDPGRERENNEDRVLCDAERGIYAVIDGVGGESGGEIAAQTALDILQARLSRRTTDAGRLIREAIALANKQIYEQAQANSSLAGMACVLTVAVVDDGHATIGHVGDSRLYQLRAGEIRKVTRDHSPVGAREDVGEISEDEAMRHPRRNEIFRDVGSSPHQPDEEGFIDLIRIGFEPDSALLLCSDGLSDLVPSQTLLAVAEAHAGDPQTTVRELIAEANAAGGKDNVSIVLVEGERYAESVRSRRPRGASSAPRRAARGAAHARPGGLRRALRALGSRPAILLYGLILGACAFGFAQGRLFGGGGGLVPGGEVLRVGVGDGGLATIGDALQRAGAGTRIEVAPGEYRESVQLRDGVSLVSLVPRAAVLLPPAGSDLPVVTAQGIANARLLSFRIIGDAQTPLQVGVSLAGSTVEVEGVEIAGAGAAGITVSGDDRSTIRYSYIHDNPGGGVLVEGPAAPRLLGNLITRNGRPPASPARPGVEVREGALPELIDNRLVANVGGGVLLATAERADEILAWNSFGGAARGQAVRTPTAQTPPAAPRPPATRSRGRR